MLTSILGLEQNALATALQHLAANVSSNAPINDVTGYTVEAATRELEAPDTQLTVETQEDTSCPATTPPVVIAQSLAPGEVPVRSTITLTYCSG